MKRKIGYFFIGIAFLSGLALLLYPLISNEWNTYRQQQLITQYEKTVGTGNEKVDYSAQWQEAHDYNSGLLPSILPDSFAIAAASDEPNEAYMACLNLAGNGMMGFIEIPKIGINVPIYHTTSEEVLQKAAGHLEGSSLPVGGESTHAVISAHRGLPSASLFTDLDMLTEGDYFIIHVLDEKLYYQVDQMLVVDPDQTEALAVEEGRDFVTLLTCTPYGVNSQRLLVRGHRTEAPPIEVEQEQATAANNSMHTNYKFWAAAGIGATGTLIAVIWCIDRMITVLLRKKKERESVSI